MDVNILGRIKRSMNEDIKLIYYSNHDSLYNFHILGMSGFVYHVIIDKNFQECNCEDYNKSQFCKHICFVLFKLLKIFRFNKKSFEIKVPFQNTLYKTDFFNNLHFSELEWLVFKTKFKNIKIFIKTSFFNYQDYNRFLLLYNKYLTYIKNQLLEPKEKCVICLDKNDRIIKCPICKNEYHLLCLMNWFKNLKSEKRCPTCTNTFWDELYAPLLYALDYKIDIDLIRKIKN